MSSMKPSSFSHFHLFFIGHLQINAQVKPVVDINLKLPLLWANEDI